MPTYKIVNPSTGESFDLEGDTPPTPEETAAILQEMAPAPVGRDNILQSAAQLAHSSVRGIRGLAVGAGRLIDAPRSNYVNANTLGAPEPTSFSQGLEAASAATKPGYKPLPQDVVPAMIGEVAATAPALAAAAGAAGPGLVAQMGS